MLIMAEGSIAHQLGDDGVAVIRAWLGPMVDAGFLQTGYLDSVHERVWMVLTSPDETSAVQRLNDLPMVRDGSISFTTTAVTGLRFT